MNTPPELQQAADRAAWLGTWIYRMDQATARGSDALAPFAEEWKGWSGVYFAQVDEPLDLEAKCCFLVHFPTKIEGVHHRWLTSNAGWGEDDRGGLTANVRWIDPETEAPIDVANGVLPDQIQAAPPAPEAFEPSLRRRADLLTQLVGSKLDLPWDRYNMLALEESEFGRPANLHLYLIPSTTDPDVMIISGWLVVDMPPGDGAELTVRLLGTSPMSIPKAPEGNMKAVFLTSISTPPTPTEAHVAASWLYDLPIYVLAEDLLWRVYHGEIVLTARLADPEAAPG